MIQACEDYSDSRRSHVAPRFGDDQALDRIVEELQAIQRGTGLERTLAVGKVVLSGFFGNDPELWRDRRRNKHNSIRRLAERPDCPFCKSALNEAVGVYVAVVAMPRVRTFGHITASHIAATLVLSDDERCELLEQAENERWSVRDTKQRAVSLRRTSGERRGRPTVSTQERAVTLLSSVNRSLASAIAEVTQLGRASESTRSTVGRLTAELYHHAESLEQWLARPAPSSRRGNVVSIDEMREEKSGVVVSG